MALLTQPEVSDYYADLELSQQANSRDIKLAFHKLAKQHHPDKKAPGKSIDAQDFRKVREAYECLIDESRRTRYDANYFDLRDQWSRYRNRETFQRMREESRQAEEKRRAARERAESERRAAEAEKKRMVEEEKRVAREKAENERIINEKVRQAEERSREAARRAREQQEQMAKERLRLEKVREAERRSEEAARKIRIEQEIAAQDRLNAILIEEKQELARRTWAQMREEADLRQTTGFRHKDSTQPMRAWSSKCAHPHFGWFKKNGPADCVFCRGTRSQWSFRCPECNAAACPICKTSYCVF
ncbi:DnaJ-domain-containing protein [Jackrogersella minutella]|nr:DnaJ-domain-containing protein [Jackrogersella minutella]